MLGAPGLIPPPTPYLELAYQNVIVAKDSPVEVDALATNSGSEFAATNPGQIPLITSQYPGSQVTSFTLQSILAGCYLTAANGIALPPVDCTNIFTGTKTNGAIVTQNFTYITGAPLGISTTTNFLQKVSFSRDFSGLKSVQVKPIVSDVTTPATGLGLDDVTYVALD